MQNLRSCPSVQCIFAEQERPAPDGDDPCLDVEIHPLSENIWIDRIVIVPVGNTVVSPPLSLGYYQDFGMTIATEVDMSIRYGCLTFKESMALIEGVTYFERHTFKHEPNGEWHYIVHGGGRSTLGCSEAMQALFKFEHHHPQYLHRVRELPVNRG